MEPRLQREIILMNNSILIIVIRYNYSDPILLQNTKKYNNNQQKYHSEFEFGCLFIFWFLLHLVPVCRVCVYAYSVCCIETLIINRITAIASDITYTKTWGWGLGSTIEKSSRVKDRKKKKPPE